MNIVKDGQLSELTELFDRYNVLLYNFFLRLTMDRMLSEDLTQTLFYRILRFRHTFNSNNGSFKSWMYQIARNIYTDWCRQKIKIDTIEIKVEDYPEDILNRECVNTQHDSEKLKKALAALSAPERELIVLSKYEGLKYAEIASIKKMTLGSVKVQIHRAMKELRIKYFEQ